MTWYKNSFYPIQIMRYLALRHAIFAIPSLPLLRLFLKLSELPSEYLQIRKRPLNFEKLKILALKVGAFQFPFYPFTPKLHAKISFAGGQTYKNS